MSEAQPVLFPRPKNLSTKPENARQASSRAAQRASLAYGTGRQGPGGAAQQGLTDRIRESPRVRQQKEFFDRFNPSPRTAAQKRSAPAGLLEPLGTAPNPRETAQRRVSLRYLSRSDDKPNATREQVLAFVGSAQRTEIAGNAALGAALDDLLGNGEVFQYGFLEAGSLMRK